MGISVRRAAGGAVSVGVLLSAAFVATASSPALGAPAAGPSVTTVAGTGGWGSSGDGGAARHARLASPAGIAVDAAGDVAVADAGNCRVRMVAARRARHFGLAMKAKHIDSGGRNRLPAARLAAEVAGVDRRPGGRRLRYRRRSLHRRRLG
jgi:hypothetical protein